MRALVVARWYPSHDVPHRGAFVADLVAGLGRAGVETVVASWEPALIRGLSEGRDALRERAAAGWRSMVRSPDALNTPTAWGSGVPVARLPVLDDPDRRSWAEAVERHAELLIPFGEALHARRPFDLVHAHTGSPDGLAAARLADELGLPLLVTEHASDAPGALAGDPAHAAAYRSLLAGRRRVAAVSPALATRIAAALDIPEDRVAVVPNAVPVERFRLALPDERDPDELLWVGGRSDKKGTGTLLRAFARVHGERPSLRLRMIGAAPTPAIEAGWHDLAAELGIAHAVVFEPPADRAAVAAAMARAAVLVHPSSWETFGMVAAEALSTGLPVAATRSGGVEAIVGESGRFGALADGTGDAALADAIRRVLAERNRFDPVAMRAHVESSFGEEAVVARVLTLYGELLGRPVESSEEVRVAELPAAAPAERPLVVGLYRVLLQRRLATLPPALASGLDAVTTSAPDGVDLPPLPAGVRIREVDPERVYRERMAALAGPALRAVPRPLRRPLRALLAPRAALRRRGLVARREALRREAIEAAVVAAWREHGAALAPGTVPWLVACDAEDVKAAAPVVAGGARLAPGGFRWLADRWSGRAPRPGLVSGFDSGLRPDGSA